MKLKDLIGKHKLDGADFPNANIETWKDSYGDCQIIRFCLDRKVYTVIKDPMDGYRSTMQGIAITEDSIINTFAPIEVIGVYRTKGKYSGKDDILELMDTKTGNIVIRIGTTDINGHYPTFVADFNPRNMITNQHLNNHANFFWQNTSNQKLKKESVPI